MIVYSVNLDSMAKSWQNVHITRKGPTDGQEPIDKAGSLTKQKSTMKTGARNLLED